MKSFLPTISDSTVEIIKNKGQVAAFRSLIKKFKISANQLSILDFEKIIGQNHNPYQGYLHYHGDRCSDPQNYTLLHAIIDSGNHVILTYYLEKYGKDLLTLHDNHGHFALSYLIYTNLKAKTILMISKILYEINPFIINIQTSTGFGLPLGTLINRMCHHTSYGVDIDFQQPKIQHKFYYFFQLGAYLLSKGAKYTPALDTRGQVKLAINCHLWFRNIQPTCYEILLNQTFLIRPLVELILDYAIDLYVNLCFPPVLHPTCRLSGEPIKKALKCTEWQDIFDQPSRTEMDLLTLLLQHQEVVS